MARVEKFETVTKERQRVHDLVACGVSVFQGCDGKRYLQLGTYGRDTRKLVGDSSQSFQLDEEAACELKRLLERTFPGI